MSEKSNLADAFAVTSKEVFVMLKTSEKGLSMEEAAERGKKYGPNVLVKKKSTSKIVLIGRQMQSPLIGILLLAMAASFLLREIADAVIIAVAIFINTILGFVQEKKAENALLALQKTFVLRARVIRSGKIKSISSSEVVLGDCVEVRSGDTVPADMRVIEAKLAEVNEALLTGESQPTGKSPEKVGRKTALAERKNMLFAGTAVTSGTIIGIVTATGKNTEVGKISALLAKTEKVPTPLQRELKRLSRMLAGVVVVVSVAIFAFGALTGRPLNDMLRVSLALAVAAIPEGMVVSLTVVLAVGMQRILKKHGLVRKLLAAETLGSTTVICTDKTGTLTTGNMQVMEVVTEERSFFMSAHSTNMRTVPEAVLKPYLFALDIAALGTDANIVEGGSGNKRKIEGNLTDRALLEAYLQSGKNPEHLRHQWKRIDALPFDSLRKYSATLHVREKEKNLCLIKGAPEKILALCTHHMTKEGSEAWKKNEREEVTKKFYELSRQGLRVIACAYSDTETTDIQKAVAQKDFTFVAFFTLKDPLRKEVRHSIQECRSAGIRIIMMTGDYALTAKAIATELGVPAKDENIIEGTALQRLSDKQLIKRLGVISVYARVTPQDKMRIVKLLQKQGNVVAMTGDGVNDAPAIKQADIGVAVGSGTDVTKETADLVILDNDFSTIVHAVEEGRGIFDNMRKIVLYLLAGSFSEILVVTGSILFGLPLPITAAQILWLNLVTDGLPNLALTAEPKELGIMNEPPRKRNMALVNGFARKIILLVSGVTGLANFFLFWIVYKTSGNLVFAQSVTFASLSFTSLIYVVSIRLLRHSLFSKKQSSNPWIWISIAAGCIIQFFAFALPSLRGLLGIEILSIDAWGMVFFMGIAVVIIIEVLKWWERKAHAKKRV